MKDLLRERLQERTLDARDWIDIRPDPHWWPAIAIPGVVGLAYFAIPHSFLPFLLIIASAMTGAMLVFAVVALMLSVLCRAGGDVYRVYRERHPKPVKNVGPMIIHRPVRQ